MVIYSDFMKIKGTTILILLVVQSLLWAGGSQESPDSMGEEKIDAAVITVTDSLDRTVSLKDYPRRIVQAGSSAFIVNDALFLFPEAKERVVAMADSNQGRGQFLAVVDEGYDEKIILPRTINMEEIMAADPDLVILKDFLFSKYDKEFRKIGIPVVYMNLESPEGWFKDLETLGALFGNPGRAEELKNQFASVIKVVEEPLKGLKAEDRKKDLILYYSEKDGSGAFQLPPLSFIQTRMLEMAGAVPVWIEADLGERWTKVGFEQIAAWDPDQIFIISYRKPMTEVLKILDGSSYWQELRAYKGGEIYSFPMDFHSWDQPDTRWLLGLQWMAAKIHPELFSSLNFEREARTIFADFYNIGDETFSSRILPRMEGINQ